MRRLALNRDKARLIYSVSSGQTDLDCLVTIFNDLRPGYEDLSVKTLDGAWTESLEIKVDANAVQKTKFAREPRAEFLRANDVHGILIEVRQEGENVWWTA